MMDRITMDFKGFHALLTVLIFLLAVQTMHSQEYESVHFQTKDGYIHAKIFGSGMPLLIINGGPGFHSDGFVPLARELSKNALVILYDLRGTGKSEIPRVNEETITVDGMISDIEQLRVQLGIEEWVVMGHSFGGMLAYAYAAAHPHRVLAMIQSSSGGYNLDLIERTDGIRIEQYLSSEAWDSLNYWRSQLANGNISDTARQRRAKYLAPAYVFDDAQAPRVADRLMQGDMRINALVWDDLQGMGFDCEELLRSFEKPVLIIHGKQDVVHPGLAKNAHKLLPNSEMILLDRCGHYGWIDRPDRYFRSIGTFLKEIAQVYD